MPKSLVSPFSLIHSPFSLSSNTFYFKASSTYFSLSFSNFKRFSYLNQTFYQSFFSYLGFKAYYVFKPYKFILSEKVSKTIFQSSPSRFIFFSDNEIKIFKYFITFFLNFSQSEPAKSLSNLSTKFLRGSLFLDFQSLNNFEKENSAFHFSSMKNFQQFNEITFFNTTFQNYSFLLNNMSLYIFKASIFFFKFRIFYLKKI